MAPGGANALCLDGSVRYLREGPDNNVPVRLIVRHLGRSFPALPCDG